MAKARNTPTSLIASVLVELTYYTGGKDNVTLFANKNGDVTHTQYSSVDWSAMAGNIERQLAGVVPNDPVKVYVANDGPDAYDYMGLCLGSYYNKPDVVPSGVPSNYHRCVDAMLVTPQDAYKDGVIDIRFASEQFIHINPEDNDGRSAITHLILGFEFSDTTQAKQYLPGVLRKLFGVDLDVHSDSCKYLEDPGMLPEFMSDWLSAQFRTAYGPACYLELLHTLPVTSGKHPTVGSRL